MAILPPNATGKPEALTPIFENFPEELTTAPQWVLWCYELRDTRWTKIPKQPSRMNASVKDPGTWSPFPAVVEAYGEGWADGVGIVLTQELGILALDFDDCPIEAAQPWLFPDSYTELSPSRKGIRQFIRGRLPDESGHKFHPPGMKELELYDRDRYMTVTGHAL